MTVRPLFPALSRGSTILFGQVWPYFGQRIWPITVWCTPGNHDVDRSVIENSPILQTLHRELRPDDPNQVDSQIQFFIQDPQAAKLLYDPIANYNKEFGSKFGCQIDAQKPFWHHDLRLNDGSVLRLHGVNSTLVSDRFDNSAEHKLIVGRAQGTMSRQDGVEYVVLCHHPPSWLLDQDQLTDIWNKRVRIQLFGHKHRPRVNQIDQSIVVAAGATHPNRREPNWRPAYNILEIWVSGEGSSRQLRVNVYPRVWNGAENQFQADYDPSGSQVRSYGPAIGEWHSPAAMSVPEPACEETTATSSDFERESTAAEAASESGWRMNPARRLTYRFLRLPYRQRMAISLKLDLIEDDDSGLRDAELFSRVFRRARERGRLRDLWREVAAAYDIPDEENPYLGS
ncbi:MAG: metallophosphoesterase [Anaerolineae bacterium]|nr:metallophosphoesterase [Anaerolineae bacterium]